MRKAPAKARAHRSSYAFHWRPSSMPSHIFVARPPVLLSPHMEQITLPGVKILVIDDEEDSRGLIHEVLTRYEAEVLCAASAAEALEILKSQTPDVIVSDIGMPEKDGYQLIREVRNLGAARGGNIPAIALTAFARPEDRMKAMIAGYQTHLPKPVEAHELIATIRTLTRWMHKPVNSRSKHDSRNKHDQQLTANSRASMAPAAQGIASSAALEVPYFEAPHNR